MHGGGKCSGPFRHRWKCQGHRMIMPSLFGDQQVHHRPVRISARHLFKELINDIGVLGPAHQYRPPLAKLLNRPFSTSRAAEPSVRHQGDRGARSRCPSRVTHLRV